MEVKCIPSDADESLPFPGSDHSLLYPGGGFHQTDKINRRTDYLNKKKFNFDLLRKILHPQNLNLNPTPGQTHNLNLIGQGAYVVITGQQPGLLGGPVLWFYKALTCIAAAKKASEMIGQPVVPVFWIAGDDSDWRECSWTALGRHNPEAKSWTPGDENQMKPLSQRPLGPIAGDLKKRLTRYFTPETARMVSGLIKTKQSYTESFAAIAQHFLGSRGILFIDGANELLNQSVQPYLIRLVENGKTFTDYRNQAEKEILASGNKPQLKYNPGALNCFAIMDGQRKRLYADGGVVYSAEKPGVNLLPLIREKKIRLTHDAWSRALVTETVFPVLSHVLGPAERRYFAQLGPAFMQEFGSAPVIKSRMNVLLLTNQQTTALTQAGLDPKDMLLKKFSDIRLQLTQILWEQSGLQNTVPNPFTEDWKKYLEKWHAQVFGDRTELLDSLSHTLEKSFQHYVNKARQKLWRDQKADFSGVLETMSWCAMGKGQDRFLNVICVFDRLGGERFENMLHTLNPLQTGDQIVIAD